MKNSLLKNLPSYQNQGKSTKPNLKNKKQGTDKTYGTQARIAAMQNIQRASGRRGN